MSTVTLEEAQARLSELIRTLPAGEEIVITSNKLPIAKIVSVEGSTRQPRFGSCRGMMTILSDDDEHLKDFAEYMP